MPIVSTFCKKGGVGKTTFIGYLAHYYANQGKTVLVISADDQNSIFKIFYLSAPIRVSGSSETYGSRTV